MTKKIALVGSAPSSVNLAPYADPSFVIWSCSPGAVPSLKRVDAHFELHVWEPGKPWFPGEYLAWLAHLAPHKISVYMQEPLPLHAVPSAVVYPKDEMIEIFGPECFTSSLAWMFALAVHQGYEEIHFYGVDMAANEEIYSQQKAGLRFLIWYARRHYGVRVIVPPQSDLLSPTRLYGFCESDAMYTKLLVRQEELNERVNRLTQEIQAKNNELYFVQGVRDDNDYHLKTWIADPLAKAQAKWNPEPKVEPAKTVEELKDEIRAQRAAEKAANEEDPHWGKLEVTDLDDYMPAPPKKRGINKTKTNGKDHPA